MASIQNVTIGPATLTYKGIVLGHTLGGAKLSYDRKFKELNVDQYGQSMVDMALISNDLRIEVTLAEPVVAQIQYAVPEATYTTGVGGAKLALGSDAGVTLRQYAGELVLHPQAKATNDRTQDVTIYLAVAIDKLEMDYTVDKQRTYKVIFAGLIDETRGNGLRLGHIGTASVS